jgi:hydroxymethylbilane synthase
MTVSTATLRLGTRASQLATTQSQAVADAITAASGVRVELVHISTEGDRSSAAIAQLGGTGVFVTAIRQALLEGTVDVAVHSYKDLPTLPEPGLTIAAVPPREDPRDALVARDGLTLGELPAGSTVGTGAPRRVAQLRALGLGLEVVPIRGNVDTRLARVGGLGPDADLDAVVLARAGLSRLGRLGAVTETLDPLQVLPAPAQGALAVECRADDERTRQVLAALDDAATRACVVAERTTLAALEAGCSAPVAAYAVLADGGSSEGEDGAELFLRASVTALDGSDGVRGSTTGPPTEAERLGRELAAELLDRGAAELMAASR